MSRRAERSETPVGTEPERPGAKGRPTRSRKEALAARQRPLVPADRKEARKRSRVQADAERARARQALVTGDERHLPPQHSGADRRLVRDIVDSRHNVAEYFFPVAIVLMLIALVVPFFAPNLYTVMSTVMLAVLWGGIALCVLDAVFIRRRLRAALTERFGMVSPGLVSYGNMRAIQIRRWRLPKPQIRHGEQPRR